MTWFDIKKLERDLIEDNVSEKEVFNYLLILTLISTVIPLSENYKSDKVLTMISVIFDVTISVILLTATFKININGDNKEYLKRLLSLSFVSIIRLIVFSLVPIMIFVSVGKVLDAHNVLTYESIKGPFILSLSIGAGVIYCFMLINSFKRVNKIN